MPDDKVQLPMTRSRRSRSSVDRAADESSRLLADLFESYVHDYVTLELIPYGEGVNLDVGEVTEFDMRLANNGWLDLTHVTIEVEATHGTLTNWFMIRMTEWDPDLQVCTIRWADPWEPTIKLWEHEFELEAGETFEGSTPGGGNLPGNCCPRVFAYKTDEPTGGTDNDRSVEVLVTARIVSGRVAMNHTSVIENGPGDTLEAFIQRS